MHFPRAKPVPGGGSAAALTAAMGAGLLLMVTRYSIGRKANTLGVERQLKKFETRLETCPSSSFWHYPAWDAEAYLGVSKSAHA